MLSTQADPHNGARLNLGHASVQGMGGALFLEEGGGRIVDILHPNASLASLHGTTENWATSAPGVRTIHGPGTGTTDYIEIDNNSTGWVDAWSLMIWFIRKTTGGFQGLFRVFPTTGNSEVDIYTLNSGNTIRADVYNTAGAATTVDTGTTFTTGALVCYCLTARGGTLRTYLNGVPSTTGATPARSARNGPLRIGGGGNANIDEVHRAMVWPTRGLMEEEVKSLYTNPYQILAPKLPRFAVPGAGGSWKTVPVKVWVP